MKTRVRAKARGNITEVTVLIAHKMSLCVGGNPTTKRTPCQFITQLVAEHNQQLVFSADLSGNMAKNPLLRFAFKGGRRGDQISVRWFDIQGNNGFAKTTVA